MYSLNPGKLPCRFSYNLPGYEAIPLVCVFVPPLQVACGFVAARIVVVLPQTYLPFYLIDTLNMDRVS